MIVLGIILILLGWLLNISVLETVGLIVNVLGLVLLFARPGGRRYY